MNFILNIRKKDITKNLKQKYENNIFIYYIYAIIDGSN